MALSKFPALNYSLAKVGDTPANKKATDATGASKEILKKFTSGRLS